MDKEVDVKIRPRWDWKSIVITNGIAWSELKSDQDGIERIAYVFDGC